MTKKRKNPAIELSDQEMQARLGIRIKYFREKMGFTNYEKFANAHDLNRSQYGRYERGEDLRFSTLVRVVRIFDITLEEFFSEGFD